MEKYVTVTCRIKVRVFTSSQDDSVIGKLAKDALIEKLSTTDTVEGEISHVDYRGQLPDDFDMDDHLSPAVMQ